MLKLKALMKFKNYSAIKKLNRLKAEMIFNKLISSVRIIFKFYQKRENIDKLKIFIKWKNLSIYFNKINIYRNEYELVLQKKFEKEISILESRIKEKEKDLNDFKNSINKQMEIEGELIKKIKNYEEREIKFLRSIKKIEEDNKILQNELRSMNSSGNGDGLKNLEIKVNFYPNEIFLKYIFFVD
jgi:hypothetical protein